MIQEKPSPAIESINQRQLEIVWKLKFCFFQKNCFSQKQQKADRQMQEKKLNQPLSIWRSTWKLEKYTAVDYNYGWQNADNER